MRMGGPSLLALCVALGGSVAPPLAAQEDWRFGWEDTWSQLGGLLSPPQAEVLQDKMAAVMADQARDDTPTGETVSFDVGDELLLRTHVVDEPAQTLPRTSHVAVPGGTLTLQLGYEPVILERATLLADGVESGDTSGWSMTVP
jgi:hypothetical protein